MGLTRIASGKKGEKLALSYLKREGYSILIKNYRTKFGEIDIVGKEGGYICFIEVRSGNRERFGEPEYTIDKKKQNRIAKTALAYIKRNSLEDDNARFDVVCIKNIDSLSPQIRLIRNAFELDNRYRY